MFVSIMAFFAQVSDPAVGGTYMTLLNTLTNLGGNPQLKLSCEDPVFLPDLGSVYIKREIFQE